jgi:predicted transcriptional regulator
MQLKGESIPSVTSVLRKISDEKTLVLLKNIKISDGKNHIPIKDMQLTTKQYYSRISGLMDVGLIKRDQGRYILTAFGKVVYEAHMTIHRSLLYYWKLKAIDSIQTTDISEQDFSTLVDALIDNYQLKDIFMKSPSSFKQGFEEQHSVK